MCESLVYFIECQDFIKIGWCRKHNFEEGRNFSELQRGNPFELKYLGVIIMQGCSTWDESQREVQKREAILHERFKDLNHRDEWFCKSQELLNYIAEHTVDPESYLKVGRLKRR